MDVVAGAKLLVGEAGHVQKVLELVPHISYVYISPSARAPFLQHGFHTYYSLLCNCKLLLFMNYLLVYVGDLGLHSLF
ncbi:hypothetical protein E1A91_A11G125700v1 [Gossypium mustelinum]|uniref:Uncharacterized protein n=1 Tax=Gossypium mustelinum TaxID=34275 RepID=A0A5D2X5M9_GOSMU|nr:hypothetical protein E1A91_A11G125700v1 [Gossypium mustelinum]